MADKIAAKIVKNQFLYAAGEFIEINNNNPSIKADGIISSKNFIEMTDADCAFKSDKIIANEFIEGINT